MKTSVNRLIAFLQKEYVQRPAMGSPTMKEAMRDCLTDMIHLSSEIKVSLPQLMKAAMTVYVEEVAEDMRSGVLHD